MDERTPAQGTAPKRVKRKITRARRHRSRPGQLASESTTEDHPSRSHSNALQLPNRNREAKSPLRTQQKNRGTISESEANRTRGSQSGIKADVFWTHRSNSKKTRAPNARGKDKPRNEPLNKRSINDHVNNTPRLQEERANQFYLVKENTHLHIHMPTTKRTQHHRQKKLSVQLKITHEEPHSNSTASRVTPSIIQN